MQMNDSRSVPASRDKVWAALNDPDVLRQCIPGCQSLEMTSPTDMTATVVIKVGPVKATFGGKVTLSDLDPPIGYRITGEGSGGVAGFAKGGATANDVALMRKTVGKGLGVKASGGVKGIDDARAMFEAGATRIGASVGVKIAQEPRPGLFRLVDKQQIVHEITGGLANTRRQTIGT